MFLVDLKSPGITVTPVPTLGDRASGTNLVHYDNVRVPAENVLGEVNGGWRCLMANLEKERMCAAPSSVGVAEVILEQAIDYVNNRIQFGKPIGTYQAIQHQLADVAVDVHIARLLMWDTANRIAKGLPAKREASITKLFCTEMLNRAAYTGMQVCGGIGYAMESDMQLHFRNARLGTIGAGSSEVMRNVLAKDLGIAQG
jgi:alkylation response protein AidB-like acyl-CoA dehydrogenase